MQVKEIEIDYSTCASDAPYTSDPKDMTDLGLVKWSFKGDSTNFAKWGKQNISYIFQPYYFPKPVTYNTTQCILEFNIPEEMHQPVFFYYRLTNFYQNHRRYV